MKTLVLVLLILLTASVAHAGDTWVDGYWRDSNRDGIKDTWVDGHHRTTPNNNIYDNYSTYPNINPYTGKQGTVKPYQNHDYNYFDSGGSRDKRNW